MINLITRKLIEVDRTTSTLLKPIPLWESLILTLAPAMLLYVFYSFMMPSLMQTVRYPFLVVYLIAWGGGEALIFFASLVVYKTEGNPSTWKAFTSRYRVHKMGRKDWGWLAGLFVFSIITYFGLTFTAEWLGSMPGFSPPDFFPSELTPGAAGKLIPGEFMGLPLKGMWWVLVVYFFGWLFNILGEEFWFRGYMLPRQELTHGRYAWIVQGVLFTLFHIFWKWNLIAILPSSLLMAYVIQRRQNTWISILSHGIMNFLPMIYIFQSILG
jgi:membrane protease YdiL (CAAX protease family)